MTFDNTQTKIRIKQSLQDIHTRNFIGIQEVHGVQPSFPLCRCNCLSFWQRNRHKTKLRSTDMWILEKNELHSYALLYIPRKWRPDCWTGSQHASRSSFDQPNRSSSFVGFCLSQNKYSFDNQILGFIIYLSCSCPPHSNHPSITTYILAIQLQV